MVLRTLMTGAALLPLAFSFPASADTLREALARAYTSNPTLTGQRAAQRANDENVPIAKAQGRPGAQGTGTYGENFVNAGNVFGNPARQVLANAQLTVPIYQGGQVRNTVKAAEIRVDAGVAGLRNVEANLFAEVVGAYMDVIRDEAVVGLNRQNVRVLETNLEASRDRFQVGDLTRTDVAQSESRLAIARAQLQSAEAGLIASRENYVRVIGTPPGVLEDPPVLPNLPATPEGAVEQALRDNPALIAAAKQRDAARYDVAAARSQRLPRLNGTLGGQYSNYLGSLRNGNSIGIGQSGESATAGLSLTVPFYQGGRPAAQVRQAQALRGQAIEQVTEIERRVIASARSSYAIWKSSQEVIGSSEVAVNANKLSLEGVRAENSVGTRTVLDILNAEQELLNSQVTLVTARRDAYVAGFNVLVAMGAAEARDLGLDGGALYNPLTHYDAVKNKWSDWSDGPAPQPVASTTTTTPPQTAIVNKPLDPILDTPVDRNPALTTGADAPSRNR